MDQGAGELMARGDDDRGDFGGGIGMTPPDPLRLAWCELSDLGNAERLAAWAAGKLVYVAEWGAWAANTGTHWDSEDGDRRAALLAHDVARNIRAEAEALAKALLNGPEIDLPSWATRDMVEERILNLRKWAVQSGNAAKTAGMLTQASHEMPASPADFDQDRFALNVLNGTLRIRKVDGKAVITRTDHDPEDRISRCCATVYDDKAECAFWRTRLEKVLPNKEIRDFFQEVIGYSFTGSNREQLFFMHQGRGGDGKSKTMDCLRDMAGSYGLAVDVKSFLVGPDRSAADASPDLVRMQGDTRLITCGEPRVGQAIDDNKVKCFTGGGKIQARPPYGRKIIEFVPRGKPHMEVNNRPRIPGADDGIWRRICIFAWPYQFTRAERAEMLDIDAVLREEWPGILNWVLEGMARWIERGALEVPKAITELVDDYRRSSSPFGEWFLDRVDTSDPVVTTETTELYRDYKGWCEDNAVGDREILSSTSFGKALGDKHIIKFKDGHGRIRRRGAKLRPLAAGAEGAGTARDFSGGGADGGAASLDDDFDPFDPGSAV